MDDFPILCSILSDGKEIGAACSISGSPIINLFAWNYVCYCKSDILKIELAI